MTEAGAAPEVEDVTFDELIERARELASTGERRILGITGAPGSGKSTLADAIVEALGDSAVLVGQDAFHLSNAELHRLSRFERKGAIDTFDAHGYVSLLRRLRARDEDVVYCAVFDRSLEESLACSVAVPAEVPLVVTEGNYLLVPEAPWGHVAGLLDECWFVDPSEEVRLERLIARHEAFGRSPEEARERSLGSDQRNAERIASTRHLADRVIRPAEVIPADIPPTSP